MISKLKKLRQEMRRRMRQRLRDQRRWLAAVLRGHYAHFDIPGNSTCIGRFRLEVMKAWRPVLLRQSQRLKLSWEWFNAILKVFPIPTGHVRDWCHQMARSSDSSEEPNAGKLHVRICGGASSDRRLCSTP